MNVVFIYYSLDCTWYISVHMWFAIRVLMYHAFAWFVLYLRMIINQPLIYIEKLRFWTMLQYFWVSTVLPWVPLHSFIHRTLYPGVYSIFDMLMVHIAVRLWKIKAIAQYIVYMYLLCNYLLFPEQQSALHVFHKYIYICVILCRTFQHTAIIHTSKFLVSYLFSTWRSPVISLPHRSQCTET